MRTTRHRAYRTALVAFLTTISFATVSSNFATAQVGGGYLAVSLSGSSVQGHGWSAGFPVTVIVDDPATSAPVDAIREGTVEPGGDFWFDIGASLRIEAGFVVTAATVDHTTSHVVLPLSRLQADALSDTVSGVAAEGVELLAWVEGDPAVYRNFTVPPGDGSFVSPSFLDDAPVGTGDGNADLGPGTTGEIAWPDLDGNETRRTWHVPQPTITVEPFQNRVISNQDWPVGALVNISLTDIVGCEQQVEVVEWGPGEYEVGFDAWFDDASCDITTGHTVTADLPAGEFGAISRSLVVTNIEVTQVDEATDRVMGYADLGSQVFLGGNSETQGAWREVTASIEGPDGIGIWVADFTAAGSTSEGDGVLDIAPGVNGTADQPDSDGDLSAAFWGIEEPQVPAFSVQRDSGDVWGGGFAPDGELSVFVDGISVFGPFAADGNGDFGIWVGESFAFAPGQLVEVGSKDLVVSGVEVTTLDPSTGLVAGEAEFGATVQVWVHEENGESYETIADGDSGDPEIGLWSVTFLDLSPGTQGAAAVSDDDGDQTQTDWMILNPTVRANPADDHVSSNGDWPLGATVTVAVDGGCVETATVMQWDPWSSGFSVDYDGVVCDVAVGAVVTATSGDIATSVTVVPLSIENIDDVTNTVTGLALLGTEVNVGGGNQDQGGWRLVAANDPVVGSDPAMGRWTADFTQAGLSAAIEGDGWFDIGPGTGGEASIPDTEGDETFVWWNVANPSFTVQRDSGDVWGGGFAPDGELSVFVDGISVFGPFAADGNGDFGIWVGESFAFAPGQLVEVGSKDLVVSGVEVTTLDPSTGLVAGEAEFGATVQVWVHEENGESYETIADGDSGDPEIGLWSVTFLDLSPGTQGAAAVSDDDGDQTQTDWMILNPTVRANPADDHVSSNGDWPLGATVTVAVDGGCVETATVMQWDPWSSGFSVDYDGVVCDVAVGAVVTATSGDIATSVTVVPLSIENIDDVTNTVTGLALLGTEVNVGGGNQDQGGWRLVAANDPVVGSDPAMGRWTADFTQAGLSAAIEGDGWFDIGPGTGGEASIPDTEGDETFVWWGVEEPQLPTFGVNVQGDTVSGGPEWIGPVTISVAGAAYVADVTEDGFFLDLSASQDLAEGVEVTVTDNTGFTKSHVVTGLTVVSVNAVTDAVEGSAYADNGVYVWIHGEDVYRYVTAQSLWQVAFTEAGLADADEGHGTFDLVVGAAGGAAEIDEDGDWTQIDWEVTNNPPTMNDPPNQTVQYSDGIQPIVFVAHDVDGASLTFDVSPLPSSILASESCAEDGTGGVVCELVLTGTMLEVAGPYLVTVDVVDPDGAAATSVVEIGVVPEDARVQLGGGNSTAVPVDSSGASGAFDLSFKIRHADPDVGYAATAGDLTLAIPEIVLHPVGPGSPVSGTCAMTSHDTGYDMHLAVTCSFDGASSNTYFVSASATGGYFDGAANGVLVVYDPSSGQVEGGGTFDWNGDLAEFGFTMEYNKKGKNLNGTFLLIRHTAAGDYLVKSNALHGMATGTDAGTAWATFAGKATVTTPEGSTVGNHEFVVRITDDPDSFWVEVLDKRGNPVPSLSMARGEEGQPLSGAALASGDVVVPKGKAQKK